MANIICYSSKYKECIVRVDLVSCEYLDNNHHYIVSSAWYSHSLGRILIVIAGCGLAQRWDSAIEEIRPGDVVWIPPGAKHWHGATSTTAMTHIAIQEQLGGKTAEWMEKVSDE